MESIFGGYVFLNFYRLKSNFLTNTFFDYFRHHSGVFLKKDTFDNNIQKSRQHSFGLLSSVVVYQYKKEENLIAAELKHIFSYR